MVAPLLFDGISIWIDWKTTAAFLHEECIYRDTAADNEHLPSQGLFCTSTNLHEVTVGCLLRVQAV